MANELARTKFNLLDVLQILSGLIFLNAILSYYFTSSTLWGYEGKFLDKNYLLFFFKGCPQKRFTPESLLQETKNTNRLLLSINKKVFDVTSNPEMYDPNLITARYSRFIGYDCTRMYINGCFKDSNQCTWDLRNIGYDENWVNKSVAHWEKFYASNPKYWQVGYLDIDDIGNYEMPEKCLNGMKYPI